MDTTLPKGWYTSKGVWGGILTSLLPLALLFHHFFPTVPLPSIDDTSGTLATLGALAATAYTIYGRVVAKTVIATPATTAAAAAKVVSVLLLFCLVTTMLMLNACTTTPDQKQTLYVVETAYTDITNDEVAYAKLSVADPAVVAKMKAVDTQVYAALVSYRTAVEAGQTPASTALSVIVSNYQTLLSDAGLLSAISPGTQTAINAAITALQLFLPATT